MTAAEINITGGAVVDELTGKRPRARPCSHVPREPTAIAVALDGERGRASLTIRLAACRDWLVQSAGTGHLAAGPSAEEAS